MTGRLNDAYVEPTLSELMAEAERQRLAETARLDGARARLDHKAVHGSLQRIKCLDIFMATAGELIR